jgi:hypothetical protein
MPNTNHAGFGNVSNDLTGIWSSDSDAWAADLTFWNSGDFVPGSARCIVASSDVKLYMMDSSASFNGTVPTAYLERRGLSFDAPESIKLIRGIRPRIVGNTGSTVVISVGASDDPFLEPTYSAVMNHTIGSTIANDCLVSGRYIAIKISNGTAFQWRLDSLDIDVEIQGTW